MKFKGNFKKKRSATVFILIFFLGVNLHSLATHAFFSTAAPSGETKSPLLQKSKPHFCVFNSHIRRPAKTNTRDSQSKTIHRLHSFDSPSPESPNQQPHLHSSRAGFVAESNPPNTPLNRTDFESILLRLNELFQPLFNHHGLHLRIVSEWDNDYVTAFAEINDALPTIRMIHVSGGMARHEAMSRVALEGVICHEIGHHLGGAPTRSMILGPLSIEGQADYYTTLKCLRHLYRDENNVEFMNDKKVPPVVQEKCQESFPNPEDTALCARVSLTAQSTALFSVALDREKQSDVILDPKFDTPSQEIVEKTQTGHSPSQCRLDTFFQGALCVADANQILSVNDPAQGACSRSQGDQSGTRPLCWYNPSTPVLQSAADPAVNNPSTNPQDDSLNQPGLIPVGLKRL